jgi:superfamily II DNA or RNA helicase
MTTTKALISTTRILEQNTEEAQPQFTETISNKGYRIDSKTRSERGKKKRFLFEMATGTGKTLISAAVIKLFS